MAYQVLSAAGTYMAEYILFDRAAARFASADSLAQFLSRFTIALNAVSLAFLALLAAPLLRRFGLRLGIVANPAVVLVFAVAMLVSATTAGPESLALFALVASARIADVALTDGVTRASLNTSFQVLPLEDRLAVQSVVEGAGLPIGNRRDGRRALRVAHSRSLGRRNHRGDRGRLRRVGCRCGPALSRLRARSRRCAEAPTAA
jgi:hypothetical protein